MARDYARHRVLLTTLCGLCSAILCLFGNGSVAAASAQPPHLPAGFFGTNALPLFGAPQSSWSLQLTRMQQGGLTAVRSDADWAWAEPNAPAGGVHQYQWAVFDAVVGALAEHDLRWYPMVGYSAPWAESEPGNVLSPPASATSFATYAAALTRRYGAHGAFWREHRKLPYLPVKVWEIWNEENGGYFWQPSPDPAGYIDLYLAARSAIRAVDPNAKAVIGGLTGDSETNTFIAGMYQHRPDAHGQIDAIGLHPYPQDSAESAASSLQLITSVRTYLDSVGESSLPIEVTEAGWTTSGSGSVDDSTRATQMTQLVNGVLDPSLGVTLFMPYTWVSDQNSPGWGMFNWDGSPTLEGTAYLNAIKAAGSTPAGSGSPSLQPSTTPSPQPSTTSPTGQAATSGVSVSHARLAGRGNVRLLISCTPSRSRCAGTLRASAVLRRGARAAATGERGSLLADPFVLAGGGSATFNVHLSPRLRSLARHHRLRIRVSVLADASPAGGSQLTSVVVPA